MDNLGINLDQSISSTTVNMIGAGAILVLSVLIVITIVVFKRWRGRFVPFFSGILTYSILTFIFTNLLMSVISMLPGVDTAFEVNPTLYQFLNCIVMAVGFALTRGAIAKIMEGHYNREGDVYLAGTGIAVGDAIAMYGLSTISYYVYAGTIKESGLSGILQNMLDSGVTEENIISEYNNYIVQLFDAPSYLWMLTGLSTILDIVLNIALMITVYGVVKKMTYYMWMYYGVVMQFLSLLLFQIYSYSNATSIIICFTLKTLVVLASLFMLKRFAWTNIKYKAE